MGYFSTCPGYVLFSTKRLREEKIFCQLHDIAIGELMLNCQLKEQSLVCLRNSVIAIVIHNQNIPKYMLVYT